MEIRSLLEQLVLVALRVIESGHKTKEKIE